MTYAGYILGFPTDTPQSIARDIEIIKKELPIDILEFFFLTPLPGSEDHKKLLERGVAMAPDMNKYDLEHACTAHPIMSKEVWEQVYRDAWTRYYSDAHIETILRRGRVSGLSMPKLSAMLTMFAASSRLEGVHPLQFGFVRRKLRRQRRPELPRENPLIFYPRWWTEASITLARWLLLMRRYRNLRKQIKADPESIHYMDEALQVSPLDTVDNFVETFADKIPKTHGAPVRAAMAG